MHIDTYKKIESFGDKECGHGATPEEIDAAEQSLGVSFPESYRQFLSRFGWGRFSYQEIYGLGSDVPAHLDLIRNTTVERSEMAPPLPKSMVPIMNDGSGSHYCLDTANSRNGECPVVFWDHEQQKDQFPETASISFEQWLIELLLGNG